MRPTIQCLLLASTCLVWAAELDPSDRRPSPRSHGDPREGVRWTASAPIPESWLARASRELEAREYHASWNGEGLQAPNRSHGLRTYFDERGIRVVDRMAAERTELLELRAVRVGRPAALRPLGAGELHHDGARVEIRRDDVVEWYENSPAGLEHGFTLRTPPGGEGPLVVDLAAAGAVAEAAGDGAVFATASGRRLHYGALVAFDATGAPLPATMTVHAHTLRIEVSDAGATYPLTIDPLLTASADAQLAVFQASAQLRYVASAGDVNGDGFGDVIVGALMYDAGETNEGAAFVFHGSATGLPINGPPAATLQSNRASSLFGVVNGAGDVNGDGYDDVIVGAYQYDSGESFEGFAFVFHGSASGVPNGNPATASGTLQANQVSAAFGISVGSAGDVDGDGYQDVIVGAYQANGGRGGAYVFRGGPTGVGNRSIATAATALTSTQVSSDFGFSVARAGDVNADGYGDVVVGARLFDSGESNEGLVYVFHGGPAGIPSGDQTTATTTLQANVAGQTFGVSVASAGDVNGDGYADVIAGASAFTSGQTNEGAAFVFHGGPAGIPSGGAASVAATTIQSNQAFAGLGIVAGAGDVNGDGYADVILGAPSYDDGQSNEGAAFVHLGGPGGVASGDPTTAFARLQPNQANATFGVDVAGAGDVNGDGYADVIAGASGFDGTQTDMGAAFVYHGGAKGMLGGFQTIATSTLESNQASAALGWSVAGAGDVNGDGYGDVIVGAPEYDAGVDGGAAFVFHGGPAGIASGGPAGAATLLSASQFGSDFGYSVAGAGDVDGDGYADVIVGAPNVISPAARQEGAAYVFRGGPSGVASGSPASAYASLYAHELGARMGSSVAGAGDVDGDGYADVVVGAARYTGSIGDEGAIFVFAGSATGIVTASPAVIRSGESFSWLGTTVAGAGDVNGDGYADVIAGAWLFDSGSSNEGAAFVFLGSASGIASGTVASAATRLESNQANAQFGKSVASAGDVNGDGFADVVVGADLYEQAQADEGAAFVFLGSPTGIPNGNPSTAAWTFHGALANAQLGASVTGLGDVNGDGLAEVAIGAPNHGGRGAVLTTRTSIASGGSVLLSSGAILESNQSASSFGRAVAGVGDVDGDGFADLVVGAPNLDLGATDEGAAYLFHGAGGRTQLLAQHRAGGGGLPIQPWGRVTVDDGFQVRMVGLDPAGRGRVKLEVERCPRGEAFGGPDCARSVAASWTDAGAGPSGVPLTHDVAVVHPDLYRWRARTLRAPFAVTQPGITAPPRPAHGPWRRLSAQAFEADLRAVTPPVAVETPESTRDLHVRPLATPARGAVTLALRLPRGDLARLELLDVAGRRVIVREVEPAATAHGFVRLDEARQLPAGIYLVRLTQGERTSTARVVLLH